MELREKQTKKRNPRTENVDYNFEYIIVIIIPLYVSVKTWHRRPLIKILLEIAEYLLNPKPKLTNISKIIEFNNIIKT